MKRVWLVGMLAALVLAGCSKKKSAGTDAGADLGVDSATSESDAQVSADASLVDMSALADSSSLDATSSADAASSADASAASDASSTQDMRDDSAFVRPDGGSGDFCGGIAGIMCADGYYCDYGSSCGRFDAGGTCRLQPDICPSIYHPVCGCDGSSYSNACSAAAAGVSVASDGLCRDCTPQDANGVGLCDAFFGYAFDGGDCRPISGCTCAGDDCGSLYGDEESCQSHVAECAP